MWLDTVKGRGGGVKPPSPLTPLPTSRARSCTELLLCRVVCWGTRCEARRQTEPSPRRAGVPGRCAAWSPTKVCRRPWEHHDWLTPIHLEHVAAANHCGRLSLHRPPHSPQYLPLPSRRPSTIDRRIRPLFTSHTFSPHFVTLSCTTVPLSPYFTNT